MANPLARVLLARATELHEKAISALVDAQLDEMKSVYQIEGDIVMVERRVFIIPTHFRISNRISNTLVWDDLSVLPPFQNLAPNRIHLGEMDRNITTPEAIKDILDYSFDRIGQFARSLIEDGK